MVMVQERGEGRWDWMACGGPMSDWVMDNRSKLPVSALLQSCNQDFSDEKRLLVLDLAQRFTLIVLLLLESFTNTVCVIKNQFVFSLMTTT